jgi:hypothetical protein
LTTKLDEQKSWSQRHYLDPDATLKEIGKEFNAAASYVFMRVNNLGITYKKKSFYINSAMKQSEKSSLKK